MNVDWITERLQIKRTKEEDFEELGPMLINYSVTKFLQKNYIQVRSIDAAKSFFFDFLFNGIISFTIRIKSTNEAIGQIGYPYNSDNMSIFYWLGSGFQGKGYATEAILELTNYIFKKSFKKKLEIPFHIENINSTKLAHKIQIFLLKENPSWNILVKEDDKENFEVMDFDNNFVQLKIHYNMGNTEIQIFDKSTFPDEFLVIGKKFIVNLRYIIISKE